jgi:RNA polymerase sigma-70 factor (ECF subfamily)
MRHPVANLLEPSSSTEARRDGVFRSTHWSQVRLAGQRDAPLSPQALESLCRLYWPPIYSFLRRSGHAHEDALDLAQGFFAYLLTSDVLQKADPARGRFRSLLLGTLKFFLSNQQARERAWKRGGRTEFVPLDAELEESSRMSTELTPERLFERRWALSVLEEALRRLGAEYERAGEAKQFALLQPFLTGDATQHAPALARVLGKSDGAARVLLCRLRNRFRRIIRSVIAETVPDPAEIESELKHLEAALRGG